MIRTKAVLDHEERNVYRLSVKASDAGRPPRHSVRALRVEVLALADNRPTFTSSSLTFNVSRLSENTEIISSPFIPQSNVYQRHLRRSKYPMPISTNINLVVFYGIFIIYTHIYTAIV